MSSLPLSAQGATERIGPADTGTYAGNAVSTSTSAANLDLNGTWGSVADRLKKGAVASGGAWFSFQARGADVYIRLKATNSAAATTTSNGVKIPADQLYEFWIPAGTPYVDHIASTSGTLFTWQSSPNQGAR